MNIFVFQLSFISFRLMKREQKKSNFEIKRFQAKSGRLWGGKLVKSNAASLNIKESTNSLLVLLAKVANEVDNFYGKFNY